MSVASSSFFFISVSDIINTINDIIMPTVFLFLLFFSLNFKKKFLYFYCNEHIVHKI